MSDLLKLNVPNKAKYVGVARMAAAAFASSLGFDIEAVEDIRLAVGEACNNVIMHSGGDLDADEYEVHFEDMGDMLTITVKDSGKGYDPATYEEPDLENPENPENVGGMGLFIIRAMMDEVDVYSEIGTGTHITMKKKINRQA